MPWVKLDDQFPEHDKVTNLADRSFRLHIVALCYCARNLTDGAITPRALKVMAAIIEATRITRNVNELVDAGLWVAAGDGYSIKDYLDYNPSGEKVREERAKARDRMSRHRGSGGTSDERSGEQDANVREKFERSFAFPLPSPPLVSKDDALTRDDGRLGGTISTSFGVMRLVSDIGGGGETRTKVDNALRSYTISDHDLDETIRCCNGPGVEDKLAVALSELKKRRRKAA